MPTIPVAPALCGSSLSTLFGPFFLPLTCQLPGLLPFCHYVMACHASPGASPQQPRGDGGAGRRTAAIRGHTADLPGYLGISSGPQLLCHGAVMQPILCSCMCGAGPGQEGRSQPQDLRRKNALHLPPVLGSIILGSNWSLFLGRRFSKTAVRQQTEFYARRPRCSGQQEDLGGGQCSGRPGEPLWYAFSSFDFASAGGGSGGPAAGGSGVAAPTHTLGPQVRRQTVGQPRRLYCLT